MFSAIRFAFFAERFFPQGLKPYDLDYFVLSAQKSGNTIRKVHRKPQQQIPKSFAKRQERDIALSPPH